MSDFFNKIPDKKVTNISSFFIKNADYVKFESLRTRLSKSGENFKNANQSVF